MSDWRASDRGAAVRAPARPAAHGWLLALATVLAALFAMTVLAAAGLWAAGAHGLPDAAFPRVVVAVVLLAVGGDVGLTGGSGGLVEAHGDLVVLPLSVSLAGALVVGAGFLAPLRHRAVVGGRELAAWAGRIAVLWLAALLGLSLGARQEFTVSLGDPALKDVGDLLGLTPTVGFAADVWTSVLLGLVWLAGVLLIALLVARRAPLPARLVRFHSAVRPAAHAALDVLLTYVVVGLVVGVVVAVTHGHAADTIAVLLLGLPNLVWLAFTLGLGAVWDGRVDGPFGLPMPPALDQVLRGTQDSALSVRTLAAQDGRAWWLVPFAAVVLFAAAYVMARRSPVGTPLWRHAVHLGVALALTVLTVCLTVRVSAHYGLSLLGIGNLGGGLSGRVRLDPRTGQAVVVAVAWGVVMGALGGLAARWRR
ncbi:streptophobe family protein [Streptomyces sp. NPDC059578]|uniref:streptophobe family protein n=1 Tax=Streptomyces sp. NPDC059578 TaxID=3346874 RepID=UPI003694C24F